MSDFANIFEERLIELLNEAASHELHSDEATVAMKNLKTFSELKPEISDEPEPMPLTRWGKVRSGLAAALDNETTRTVVKAGGTFAGVVLVVYTTVRKDHILERQALQQANQRS